MKVISGIYQAAAWGVPLSKNEIRKRKLQSARDRARNPGRRSRKHRIIPASLASAESYRAKSLAYASRAVADKVKPNPQFDTEYAAYLHSDHWRLLRLEILSTRGSQCERCKKFGRVDVHHLTYLRIGRELPSDLQVLCRSCHKAQHFPIPGAKSASHKPGARERRAVTREGKAAMVATNSRAT